MTAFEFILYVSDQHRSKEFYRQLLRLEPVLDVPGMTEFQLVDNCKLGIMPENGIAKILTDRTQHPEKGNGIPRCELYLKVSDVREYFERAMMLGAKKISEVQLRDWGDLVGYVQDFDGHIVAFAE